MGDADKNSGSGGFRLKLGRSETDNLRELDLGRGVRVRLRWDAVSCWDIVRMLGARWQRISEEEKANEVVRIARDYVVWWNVLDDQDRPAPLSPDAVVDLFNQEPGFLLALLGELGVLAQQVWQDEKKSSPPSPNGTAGEPRTAATAQRSNSRAPGAKRDRAASAAT